MDDDDVPCNKMCIAKNIDMKQEERQNMDATLEIQWKFLFSLSLCNSYTPRFKIIFVTMLGLSLYTQALVRGCVHTKDTKWKESAFYANIVGHKYVSTSPVAS